MYVCVCHALTEEHIFAAVDAGAVCVRDIYGATRAGSSCGTCFRRVHGTAREALRHRNEGTAPPRPALCAS